MKVKIVIAVAVVAVVAAVAVLLLSGGDDEPGSTGDNGAQSDDKSNRGSSDGGSGSSGGDAPALRTVGSKRATGSNPAPTASAFIRSPGEIWIRVSAAPKQEVTVNWTLACGTGATSTGSYDVTPPDTRQLKLPAKKPKVCVASASTQLKDQGRARIAVMRDR